MRKGNLVRSVLVTSFTLAILFQQTLTVAAAFGDPDPSFGSGGVYTDSAFLYTPHAIATQADGKILSTGFRYEGNLLQLILRRYNANGTVDLTFGINGTAVPYNIYGRGNALLVQSDARIVVVGADQSNLEAVWRFDSNGWYDPGFGYFGRTVLGKGSLWDIASYRPARDPFAGEDLLVMSSYEMYRLRPNGVLDPSFGSGGTVSLATVGNKRLAIHQSSIYTVGFSNGTGAAIAKYTISGQPDLSFGNQGVFSQNVFQNCGSEWPGGGYPGVETYTAIGVQSNGRIISVGNLHPYFSNLSYALLTGHQTNGSFDSGFNPTCDLVVSDGPYFGVHLLLAIQPDDSMFVSAKLFPRIFKFAPDGTLVDNFPTSRPVIDFLVQSNGRIVVVGMGSHRGVERVELSRYLPN